MSSGVESSPGVKDPGRIRDFVQAAREAGRLVAAERSEDPTDPVGSRRATDLFDWQDDT